MRALLLCLLLVGCATPAEPKIEYVIAKCIKDPIPERPRFVAPAPDAGIGDKSRAVTIYATNLETYADKVGPILAGCQ